MKTCKNFHAAKRNKNDEFYTQRKDIEIEVKFYEDQLKGKVVFCNCNDGNSQFFHFFTENFERLQLAGLLIGQGDFRSDENIELLKKSDIVVTNPPFSLFREFIAQLVKYGKKFLVIGNLNAVAYKDIFPLFKKSEICLGQSVRSRKLEFEVPEEYPLNSAYNRIDENGNKFILVNGIRWFTNFVNKKPYLVLTKKYSKEEYPYYDNYDAININKIKDIPCDYSGAMGVPITFLDKYNPEQFDILGLTSGRNEIDGIKTKIYNNPKQVNKNGSVTNGGKVNTICTLLHSTPPSGIHYVADNINGYLQALYARILIKNKNPK